MQKPEMIERIKKIIEDYGQFGIEEVEADCSPCVNSMGCLVGLAEGFGADGAEIEVYDGNSSSCESIASYVLKYDEIDESVLAHIVALAQKWEEVNFEASEGE